MAQHPDAVRIRDCYEAFSRGDVEALRGLMASSCRHQVPGSHPLAGEYKGIDSILAFYGQLAVETGGTMRIELLDAHVDGRGRAVSIHRCTAERRGKAYDQRGSIVFTIADNEITDLDEYVGDLSAADDFWS